MRHQEQDEALFTGRASVGSTALALPILFLFGCSVAGLGELQLPQCATDRDCETLDLGLPAGSCQQHACGAASGRCVLIPRDADRDGSSDRACGGDDCDDEDPEVHPGAAELCGNRVDEDCDGVASDLDCDGEDSADNGGEDCNDLDPLIGPRAREVCGNDVDEDCDGAADDLDCDGVSSTDHGGGDCDDHDPSRNPLRRELCNGVDDNCDGALDGPDEDDDGDGHADECAGAEATDCDDEDPLTHFDAIEVCDGVDNDCVVDGLRRTGGGRRAAPEEDADGDGHASPQAACHEVGLDGEVFLARDDCDDSRSWVYPEAFELCDGLDTDCDGLPDDVEGVVGEACLSFVEVVAGAGHSCLLQRDGTAVCWGENDRGQLGVEATEPYDAVLVPGVGGLRAIDIGDGCSCGLHEDGGVSCWGARTMLRTGRAGGSELGRVAVEEASQLSVGAGYACAVVGDGGLGGEVWCWGTADQGEIDGVTEDTRDATGLLPGHLPAPVPGVTDAIQVAAGDGVSCALRQGGGVTCWGDNGQGQLGDGAIGPVGQAEVVGLDDATQVAVGDRFACAVRADRTLWCWGRTIGGAGESPTPGAMAGLDDVAMVAAGTGDLACALDGSGRVWCWGDNSQGQLGQGTLGPGSTTPLPVMDIDDAERLSVGSDHACALRADGRLSCWGNNAGYQLGLGHARHALGRVVVPSVVSQAMQIVQGCFRLPDLTVRCADPGDEPPPGATDLVDFDLGASHRCALELDGEVRCAGEDRYGQLGVGDTGREAVVGLVDAAELACGESHCCAARETGRVACWGDNRRGQLGVEDSTPTLCMDAPCSPIPVVVEGLSGVESVVAGRAHSCALVEGGRVFCWGDNRAGQVGSSIAGAVRFASEVSGLPAGDPAVGLAAAWYSDTTCAVLSSGGISCWGERLSSLPDGGPDPRPLAGMSNVVQASLSMEGLCARLGSGAVACLWVDSLPVSIEGVRDARDVGCGELHCCLTRTSGQSLCWGLVPAGLMGPLPVLTDRPLPVFDLF